MMLNKMRSSNRKSKICRVLRYHDDARWSHGPSLNDLRLKNHIRVWQLDKMMPKREKVALAYLYFIPKPHKVSSDSIFARLHQLLHLLF